MEQENELNQLRQKIRNTREEYTRLSNEKLLQGSDFKQRQSDTELQNLRQQIKSQEAESSRLESHYENIIQDLKNELQRTRSRLLQVSSENKSTVLQLQKDRMTLQDYQMQLQQIKSLPDNNTHALRPFQMYSVEKEVQTEENFYDKQETVEENYLNQMEAPPMELFEISAISIVNEVQYDRENLTFNEQYVQTENQFIGNDGEEQFSNQEIMAAIKQLSMIILSKREQLDERTREVVEKTFGCHFGNVINSYENKIKELETSYAELKSTMRLESDNYLMALQRVKKLSDYLLKIKQVLQISDQQQIATLENQLQMQESDLIKQGNQCLVEFERLRTEIDSRRRISICQDFQQNSTSLYRDMGQEGGKLKQLLNENAQLRIHIIELKDKELEINKLETKIKQLQEDKRKQVKKRSGSCTNNENVENQQDIYFYMECMANMLEGVVNQKSSFIS